MSKQKLSMIISSLHDLTVKEAYKEWLVIRKMELKPSTLRTQNGTMCSFVRDFGS